MNCVNVELEIDRSDLQQESQEVAALSADQLELIAGGECVVNSI